MFKLNNKPLGIDVPFTTEDGTQYPANWLRLASPEERAAIGITEVADEQVSYDDRFYWGPNNPKLLNDREESDEQGNPLFVKVLGEVDGQPAMVDSDKRLVTKGLKSQYIEQIKATANSLMAPTDWMVIRQLFKGIGMSAIHENYRDAVVAESNRLEVAIINTNSVEELISVLNNQQWPESV